MGKPPACFIASIFSEGPAEAVHDWPCQIFEKGAFTGSDKCVDGHARVNLISGQRFRQSTLQLKSCQIIRRTGIWIHQSVSRNIGHICRNFRCRSGVERNKANIGALAGPDDINILWWNPRFDDQIRRRWKISTTVSPGRTTLPTVFLFNLTTTPLTGERITIRCRISSRECNCSCKSLICN